MVVPSKKHFPIIYLFNYFVPDFSGLDSFLDGLGSLPDMAKDELESAMTVEELRYIGLDGISYEFYKITVDLIQEDLLKVFQCQLDIKRMVESNTEGVTRLGPKVDGIPGVDELRPITLLNSIVTAQLNLNWSWCLT